MRRAAGVAMLAGMFAAGAGASLPLPLPDELSPQTEGYMRRAAAFEADGFMQAADDQLRHVEPSMMLSVDEAVKAEYLKAAVAFGNDDPHCISMLAGFLASHPASPLSLNARLMLADSYFFHGDFQRALRAYREVDASMLSGDRRLLYSYREALSLLKCGFLDEAGAIFRTLRPHKEYSHAARFYEAYIDYAQDRLDAALTKFRALPSTGEYGLEADFYILQILYAKGEYGEVASRGPALLERNNIKPDSRLLPETLRVIGLSLFKLGEKRQAAQWLQRYVDIAGEASSRSASYALGTIRYDEGDHDSASALFGALTDDNDDIAQSAWLYIGQIALAGGDDNTAALAFERAAATPFDHNVSETALYNYATSLVRGGKVPFRSGIEVLESFSRNYPSSRYASAVDEYLAVAYFNASDYESALRSIEKIRVKSDAVKAARQKILYELGMQRMVNGDPGAARTYLEGAVAGGDSRIAAQSALWLGDALYALGDYGKAAQAYSKALAGGLTGDNSSLARYNLAYALNKKGDYQGALPLFRKAASDGSLSRAQQADSRMRAADCLYYTGNYQEAKKEYRQLASDPESDALYAALRQATIMGKEGDVAGKIALLKKTASLPEATSSRWMPEILESLAKAYAEKGDDAGAASVYEQYLSLYPSGRRAASSTLALARSYQKAGQTVKSEIEYKNVIERWPSSEEARQADADLRRIFAADGRLYEYAEYLRNVPGGFSIDAAEIENLTFEAAEDAWNENPDDLAPLRAYLERYPTGSDADAAWYMVAESLHDSGRRPEALDAYRHLLAYGPGDYYVAALAGVMRNSDDSQEVLSAARRLQSASGTAADIGEEAAFYEASALADSNDSATRAHALSLLGRLAENPAGLWGVRAAVRLASLQLESGRPAAAEKTLLAMIDAGTPHQYWLARGYILLADVYSRQGKDYLSRQYLESLRDNYPGDDLDIHNIITTRLRQLK